MRPGATIALVLAAALGAGLGPDEDLERWVQALDAAREPEWSAAFERLQERGPAAVERVLVDFESVDFAARRGRARLLLKHPRPGDCARVLHLVGDPDPSVRRMLALWLGDLALADSEGAARVATLERLVKSDPSAWVRDEALRSLAECGLPGAVPALDRLVLELDSGQAEGAAKALAGIPIARERLVARVIAALAGEVDLASGVVARLLQGYGRALAEVPLGGREARERAPLLVGRLDPSPEVRAAAAQAWNTFVARTAELTEPERADFVLARLAEEGWPAEQCLRRRLDLCWRERGDPEAARALAEELLALAQRLDLEDRLFWETQARFFRGAALFVSGENDRAERAFADLAQRLEAQRRRRMDLFDEVDGKSPGGSWAVDRLQLLALAHEWRAVVRLARGDEIACAQALRDAHEVFLESRAVAQRAGGTDPYTLDALFDRDLSPQSLVLFNQRLGTERRAGDLDLALRLAEIWAGISPTELLGFEPRRLGPRMLSDPFLDPGRLTALKALRAALRLDLERQRRDLLQRGRTDPQARLLARLAERRVEEIAEAERGEERALAAAGQPGALPPEVLGKIYAQLGSYLGFSMHALGLAGELRAEGQTARARAVAERALATLRSDPGSAGTVYVEWASARFELLRGSSFMDDGRPDEAERASLEAVRRLEAMENTFVQQGAQQGAQAGGPRGANGPNGAGEDPEQERAREAQVRMVRSLLADAWMSLAVNANVRQGNVTKAVEYFERAYELNQNPFMRVLRACYRARSGQADEARAVLASVTPSPALYYNTACTWALLGEPDLALDFLERDFRENYPTSGSLARQREWAKSDPDLASLRGDSRFARLLGE